MTPTDTVVSEERLTYADLREANIARQAAWCPDQVPDLSFRGNELAGETGEVCNVIKKLERERLGWRGSRDTVEHLAEELADVVICADLCALSAGIDLNEAVAAKFNATSEKVGLPHRLTTPSLPPRSSTETDKAVPAPATGGEVEAVTLAECPIGLFYADGGELCLKTEYGNNEGRIDAYIVSSGEFFWGGASSERGQRAVKVRPVSPAVALRRPETDKPGVREAALEEATKVADMFAADHAKSADQFGIDRNREMHNAAKGAAQGVAFAIRALSVPLAAEQPVALAYSGECIDIAREAFDAWASKPHNKRWFKRIDGTPIINDIIVNMAVTFGAHGVIAKRAPSDLMVPLSALTAQAAALEAAERGRDEARQIVRDIFWMALRYADGRKSYAPGMCNRAVQKGYDGGWLDRPKNDEHTPALARDGDFDGEWTSIEARAEAAEKRIAELEAGLDAVIAIPHPDSMPGGHLGPDALLGRSYAVIDNMRRQIETARRLTHQEEEQWPVG